MVWILEFEIYLGFVICNLVLITQINVAQIKGWRQKGLTLGRSGRAESCRDLNWPTKESRKFWFT